MSTWGPFGVHLPLKSWALSCPFHQQIAINSLPHQTLNTKGQILNIKSQCQYKIFKKYLLFVILSYFKRYYFYNVTSKSYDNNFIIVARGATADGSKLRLLHSLPGVNRSLPGRTRCTRTEEIPRCLQCGRLPSAQLGLRRWAIASSLFTQMTDEKLLWGRTFHLQDQWAQARPIPSSN